MEGWEEGEEGMRYTLSLPRGCGHRLSGAQSKKVEDTCPLSNKKALSGSSCMSAARMPLRKVEKSIGIVIRDRL
jgi:hypothetical protein